HAPGVDIVEPLFDGALQRSALRIIEIVFVGDDERHLDPLRQIRRLIEHEATILHAGSQRLHDRSEIYAGSCSASKLAKTEIVHRASPPSLAPSSSSSLASAAKEEKSAASRAALSRAASSRSR